MRAANFFGCLDSRWARGETSPRWTKALRQTAPKGAPNCGSPTTWIWPCISLTTWMPSCILMGEHPVRSGESCQCQRFRPAARSEASSIAGDHVRVGLNRSCWWSLPGVPLAITPGRQSRRCGSVCLASGHRVAARGVGRTPLRPGIPLRQAAHHLPARHRPGRRFATTTRTPRAPSISAEHGSAPATWACRPCRSSPFGFGLRRTPSSLLSATLQTQSGDLRERRAPHQRGDYQHRRPPGHGKVVAAYIRDLVGSLTRPVRELKGFQRVTLQPERNAPHLRSPCGKATWPSPAPMARLGPNQAGSSSGWRPTAAANTPCKGNSAWSNPLRRVERQKNSVTAYPSALAGDEIPRLSEKSRLKPTGCQPVRRTFRCREAGISNPRRYGGSAALSKFLRFLPSP